MSKKLFGKFFIFLLVVGLLFAAAPTGQALAESALYVDDDFTESTEGWGVTHFATIQAAITAATAGDTITVAAGTYVENVTVDKQLTIVGAGAESVTVDASVSTLPCFHITADGVSLSGFTVTGALNGSTDAILLDSADNCTISNNIATNNYWGITLYNAKNNTLTGNVANLNTAVGIGLVGADTTGNQIVGNTASNNASNGILLSPGVGGNNIIDGNTVSANGKNGISISSSNNTVTNNTITGNATTNTQGAGIALFDPVSGNTIQFNTITGNGGYGGIGSISSGQNDVSKNWWGSATGPTHDSNPGGTGDVLWTDKAITLLTYSPWLANPAVHNVTQGTYHATIQAAINAATNGDTIEVAAGTYVEDVTVTNKFFNLIGEVDGTGAPVSILQGTLSIDNPSYGPPSPPEFTLIKNIYFEGTDNHLLILKNLNGGLVENCVFDGNGRFLALPNINGINLVSGPNGNSDITVTGSLFKDGLYVGIGGYADGLTVQTSEFTNVKSGINLQGGGNLVVTGSTFLTKPVSDGDSYGIRFASASGATPNLTVTGSTFNIDDSLGFDPASGDYHAALYIRAGATGSLELDKNQILGDVVQLSTTSLDASPNWWGSVTGPAAGQMVGDVKYLPYCTNAACTTFSEAKLSMDPATINATTCGPQYVDVMVTDVADLTAYHLEVTFDRTKVRIDSVVNGGFLHETVKSTVIEMPGDLGNTTGKLVFEAYLQAKPGYAMDPGPVSGSGSLIRINFTPLLGTTTFAVDGVNSLLVGWPEADPMPFSATGATATLTGGVVRNTNTSTNYCSLATAVADAGAGHNLQVLSDITLTETITIDKALTLDLNGKVATASTGINALNVTTGGALIVNDSGTTGKITGGKRAVLVNGGGSLTLTKGTLEGPGFDGVFVYGEGSSVTVNGGTITGLYYGISGNGSAAPSEYYGSTNILITGGTVQGGETAIFHPQLGPLTINGGEIIGGTYNGIEMKAGDLTITGGTITTSAGFVGTPAKTDNGNTQSGDAILIYNRAGGYPGTMTVNITGGTITSTNGYALREYTYEGESSRTTLVKISGGHFTGGTPGAVWFATNTELVMELVGGDYSADPITYVYTPYSTYQFGSRWYITKSPTITSNVDQGYYLAGEEKAFDVTMNLPAGGIDLALMIFDYKLAGVTTADITKFEFFAQDIAPAGAWIDMGSRLTETYGNCTDNSGICGKFGWAPGGFGPIAAGFTNTTQFRVTFAKGFTAPLSFTLDLSGKLAATDTAWTPLTTYTGTLDVYDKATVTVGNVDPYFLVDEPGAFNVTVSNPTTGRYYNNTVVFDVEITPPTGGGISALVCTSVAPMPVHTWTFDSTDFTVDSGTGKITARLGGEDDYFIVPNLGIDGVVNCTATFTKEGTYSTSGNMVDVVSTAPVVERIVSNAVSASVDVYRAPEISAVFPAGPYLAGVPVTIPITITNPDGLTDPFKLQVVLSDGTTLTFVVDPAGYPTTQNIVITFEPDQSGDVVLNLYDDTNLMNGRLLDTATQTGVVVNSGFTVTGNFSMQGNLSRAGVPVTFTWGGDLVSYGPTGYSTDVSGTNFSQVLTYGGSYTITTNQPRYLNVYEDGVVFFKTINLTGDRLLPELRLRGGNAYWRVVDESNVYTDQYDNTVNGSDASVVGTDWGPNSSSDLTINHGDVNFDGKVNIQDLALVGGNYYLTSAVAYDSWLK